MFGNLSRNDWLLVLGFSVVVLISPWTLTPLGAGYPALLQKFCIFGIFAMGFNILFGLTGYLSFGHAAFLGVGSYAAVWSFKLFTMNVIPAVIFGVLFAGLFAVLIGYVSLRRSGIYFSILTLAFAQMSYNLAYSVLTPITNGETGLQLTLQDPRIIDNAFSTPGEGLPATNFFGIETSGYPGFYFCAVALIICFFLTLRIFRSPFGMMLRAIKSNQNRMRYTGFNTRPYLLTAFVISGMYAGLAGSLMAVTDPHGTQARHELLDRGGHVRQVRPAVRDVVYVKEPRAGDMACVIFGARVATAAGKVHRPVQNPQIRVAHMRRQPLCRNKGLRVVLCHVSRPF